MRINGKRNYLLVNGGLGVLGSASSAFTVQVVSGDKPRGSNEVSRVARGGIFCLLPVCSGISPILNAAATKRSWECVRGTPPNIVSQPLYKLVCKELCK